MLLQERLVPMWWHGMMCSLPSLPLDNASMQGSDTRLSANGEPIKGFSLLTTVSMIATIFIMFIVSNFFQVFLLSVIHP